MGPESTVPMHPQLRLFTSQLFLDFRATFSPEWPLIFLVNTIHQVIWPSPGPWLMVTHHSHTPFVTISSLNAVKGCRSVREQVAPLQQLFASPPPATSSSEICRVCIFASCRCLFPPADLPLRHLFIGSECNYSCIRLTASSRAVVIFTSASELLV